MIDKIIKNSYTNHIWWFCKPFMPKIVEALLGTSLFISNRTEFMKMLFWWDRKETLGRMELEKIVEEIYHSKALSAPRTNETTKFSIFNEALNSLTAADGLN